jgi:catechol 2,3-dioxygenase-like lactoylglutathione lyase family enzyme
MRRLKSICLVTRNVQRLREFYEQVLQAPAEGDDAFAEFSIQGLKPSICSAQLMETMAPGSTAGIGSGNSVLEFEVEDVDQEYERLKLLAAEVVKLPTTQPWGIRSVWFRDSDGNLVNFFRPAAPSAGDQK